MSACLILIFSDVTCCGWLCQFHLWSLFVLFSWRIDDGVWRDVSGYHVLVYDRMISLDIYFTWSHVLLDTCALAGVAVLCGKCGCFCPSSIKDADSDRQPVEKKKVDTSAI